MIVTLGDGRRTTVRVAEFKLAEVELRVVRLPGSMPLLEWCAQEGVADAMVGGFYVRQPQVRTDPAHFGVPLGDLQSGGEACGSLPFDPPWGERRACVHAHHGVVTICRRERLPADPEGDLLQAGPMLVEGGTPADVSPEGFSSGSGQFDSDITRGRHPRAAIGTNGTRLFAVASEGRTRAEAGLSLAELAEVMLGLGASSAMNLDGGGSTSLVREGKLINSPREGDGTLIEGGRPIATALAFIPRADRPPG